MSYRVRLNTFEGPFDLLVYLIERAEMSIYDIRISEITAQYLAYIRRLEENDVAVGSDFMVLAATLIDIKSKMLLPRMTEEGIEAEDPRTDLTKKLLEYVRFKKAAGLLEAQREYARLKLEKPQEDLQPYTGVPDIYLKMDMDGFIAAFRAFIHRKVKGEELLRMQSHIERERISLESKTSRIAGILEAAKKRIVRFAELLSPQKEDEKYDKVVTLIAVLDMAREGRLRAQQEVNFAEIEITGTEE
ncbi:MAG: segregation/condensation protein A [Clostridiales Family XIII bacterium]|jgi:segregation and condensation protein A|nr:segregation/condensation protein A [Clostridiales Family XIII bacterium]